MSGAMLTALIGAYEPGPGGLRALTPLAGATLVEHQARRAIAAGATRIVLLVESVPSALAAALAHLREDGIPIAPAEGIDAAADLLADTQVLLIADACLPTADLLAAIATAPMPALATVEDRPDHSRYERIDAEARWAGVALLDGHRVAATAAMLGSWDPVSTLLRRAVQEEAHRVPADATPPLLLVEPDRIASAEVGIVRASRGSPRSLPDRFINAPLEELALPPLLRRGIGATPLAAGGAALGLIGGAVALASWPLVALLLLIASGLVEAVAARLGRVHSRPPLHARWLSMARIVGTAATLLGLAQLLARQSGQWGWWLIAAAIGFALAAARELERIVPLRPLWLARIDAMVWAMLPFALAGRWSIGLGVLAIYAGGSAAWLLRQATGRGEERV